MLVLRNKWQKCSDGLLVKGLCRTSLLHSHLYLCPLSRLLDFSIHMPEVNIMKKSIIVSDTDVFIGLIRLVIIFKSPLKHYIRQIMGVKIFFNQFKLIFWPTVAFRIRAFEKEKFNVEIIKNGELKCSSVVNEQIKKRKGQHKTKFFRKLTLIVRIKKLFNWKCNIFLVISIVLNYL